MSRPRMHLWRDAGVYLSESAIKLYFLHNSHETSLTAHDPIHLTIQTSWFKYE